MRKLALGVIAASMALTLGSASAETHPNGCAIEVPVEQDTGASCTYTATGIDAQLLNAGPNDIKVTYVDENNNIIPAYSSDWDSPDGHGHHTVSGIPGGVVVTLTVEMECAPENLVCGHAGPAAIYEFATE